MEHGPEACDAPTFQETDLQNAVAKAINELLGSRDEFLPMLEENIAAVIGSDISNEIAEIDCRLAEQQKKLLKLANAKKDYLEVTDEIYRLREQRHNVMAQEEDKDGKRQRVEEMKAFLQEQVSEALEYDEKLVRKLIEKVTVYEDRLTVEFKSGLEIDVVL